MKPDRIWLVRLRPETRRFVTNALQPLGWDIQDAPGSDPFGSLTPDGTSEVLICEAPLPPDRPEATPLPTLWVLPPGAVVPQKVGKGPHDFVRLPVSCEEVVARLLNLVRVVQSERALRRLEAEAARQIKRRRGVVSTIAHDIMSPLTAVIEYLELALDGTAGIPSDPQKRLLGEAQGAARRVAEMIEGIVDASRTEVGIPLEVEMRRTELRPLFVSIQEAAMPRLREKRQTLSVHLEADVPPVCGDPVRIEQALRHLVENAYRFSPPGAQIEIGALCEPEMTGYVRICVSDTGSGIDPEELIERFDPFAASREDRGSRKRPRVGLALGRAVAQAIGGEIAVSPRSGGGTQVSLRIPVWGSRAARIAQAQVLLASPDQIPGSRHLHRVAGSAELIALGSHEPWMTLSPGEVLVLSEEPIVGVTRLGRVSEFREAGSLADALKPRMMVKTIAMAMRDRVMKMKSEPESTDPPKATGR